MAKKVKKRGCASDEFFMKLSSFLVFLKINEDIRYNYNFDLLFELKFVQILQNIRQI